MVLMDKGKIVTNEEKSDNGDEIPPLEEVPFDKDKEVYKEMSNMSLVVMCTLNTQVKEE